MPRYSVACSQAGKGVLVTHGTCLYHPVAFSVTVIGGKASAE